MREDPKGIKVLKEKLEKARTQKITKEDADEVDRELHACCDLKFACGRVKECQELDDRLSDFIPSGYRPGAKLPKLTTHSKSGSWIPQVSMRQIRQLV